MVTHPCTVCNFYLEMYENTHIFLFKNILKAFKSFGLQIIMVWAYVMKVIPETRRAH